MRWRFFNFSISVRCSSRETVKKRRLSVAPDARTALAKIAARMRRMRTLLLVLIAAQCLRAASTEGNHWTVLTQGVDTNLRAISASWTHNAGNRVAVIWAAGSNGVVLRSPDAGKNWKRLHVPGGDKLDFRGLQSFGDSTAYLMSIGDKGDSRIFKTTDAGKTWRLEYSDPRSEFFLDTLVCRSEKDCFAITDPIGGKFLLLHTADGEHWTELPREKMPPALDKEGVFAASNSSLTVCGDHDLLFGTGGPAARVFHSTDSGQSWTVAETPIIHGDASTGIFSLRCSGNAVVAVGGDYRKIHDSDRIAAYSRDLGATWTLSSQGPSSFRSGVELLDRDTFVAVGPAGAEWSTDSGISWKPLGASSLNAVIYLGHRFFAVGSKGRVATVVLYIMI
jgi:photosystem II stability/assembly factor-like uncharacterized protein